MAMPMQTKPLPPPRNLWQRVARAVRNDPKKAATLTALVAILVVLQVRLHMSKADEASRANAASMGAGTSQNPDGSAGGRGAFGRPIDSAAALRAWMDAAPALLGRNLFAINL